MPTQITAIIRMETVLTKEQLYNYIENKLISEVYNNINVAPDGYTLSIVGNIMNNVTNLYEYLYNLCLFIDDNESVNIKNAVGVIKKNENNMRLFQYK